MKDADQAMSPLEDIAVVPELSEKLLNQRQLIGALASPPATAVIIQLPNSEATIGGGVMIAGASSQVSSRQFVR